MFNLCCSAWQSAHTITTVGMLAAISGVLMVIELPLFFAPPFYKLDFSELPVLICAFSLGPVAGVVCEFLKVLIHLLLKGTSTAFVGDLANFLVDFVPEAAEQKGRGRFSGPRHGRYDRVRKPV